MVEWPSFLPLVWEGRPEWEDSGNHLQSMHYHLGLICAFCLDYLMSSAEVMHWHTHLCKHMTSGDDEDNRDKEDYEDDDNGDEDDEFVFKED